VVGDVVLGDDSNVWYGVVIRGDVGKVRIGKRVNLQDLVCVHMTTDLSDAVIGDDVSIGHSAIVHGAIIEDGALIGMGSILMDNARIGRGAIVGAGSLVTSGTVIAPGTLALGRPAKVIRELSSEEARAGVDTAHKYVGLARAHAESGPRG
jgi:carbonic anhydrase/acetyltransferase-like protein (isoleucine patch superfamily)